MKKQDCEVDHPQDDKDKCTSESPITAPVGLIPDLALVLYPKTPLFTRHETAQIADMCQGSMYPMFLPEGEHG